VSEIRVVLTTTPDRASAEALAHAVIEERLAACASLVPGLVSIFRWEGAVQRADEVLVVIKAAAQRVDALVARVAELHPYDVPEVLALPVAAGFEPYLDWVERECDERAGRLP
jgi:periplasmic divalent cation tolerance protein